MYLGTKTTNHVKSIKETGTGLTTYASGEGYFFSKGAISKFKANVHLWDECIQDKTHNTNYWEDWRIGLCMRTKFQIELTEIPYWYQIDHVAMRVSNNVFEFENELTYDFSRPITTEEINFYENRVKLADIIYSNG